MEVCRTQTKIPNAFHPSFVAVQICGGAEALHNRQVEKAHKTAQTENSMKQPLKAKALSAIVSPPLTRQAQVLGLTMRSNHSLRSLGRAKARPLA